jgi:phosphatidylglycerophosphate synthase
VTPPALDPVRERALAFKAYEIEELADVYFFRPAGAVVAHAARRLRLSPTQLSVFGGLIGIVGGSLLYDVRLGLSAFGLLILHGIVDSADGQLARLTGRTSELGRLLDGVAGYVTHAAMYVALVAGILARGGSPIVLVWAVAAAVSNVVQAQMYDYHRTAYATVVVRGRAPQATAPAVGARWVRGLLALYTGVQRRLIGTHAEVERVLLRRAEDGRAAEADRLRYRACFYWLVRGWNLLGDNTRFYAIGVLAWAHRLPWFFPFIALPMNAALVLLWLGQARADRRFLQRV